LLLLGLELGRVYSRARIDTPGCLIKEPLVPLIFLCVPLDPSIIVKEFLVVSKHLPLAVTKVLRIRVFL
jgi:hypothetical protein